MTLVVQVNFHLSSNFIWTQIIYLTRFDAEMLVGVPSISQPKPTSFLMWMFYFRKIIKISSSSLSISGVKHTCKWLHKWLHVRMLKVFFVFPSCWRKEGKCVQRRLKVKICIVFYTQCTLQCMFDLLAASQHNCRIESSLSNKIFKF